MPTYDAERFTPPAPTALVKLRDPGSGTVISDVPVLLDTGADVTLFPGSAIQRLGIVPESGHVRVHGASVTVVQE
jgi:hypothetical protein